MRCTFAASLKLKHYIVALFAVFFVHGPIAWSQLNPPTLNCLSVDPDNNVILNWEQPSDPNMEFQSYHLFYIDANNINGPYGEIILDTYNTTTYVHTGAFPGILPFCYYVVTESFDGTTTYFSTPSDTLCTIFLSAIPSVGPEGFADLFWNSPYPFAAPPGLSYQIWMEFPAGIWQMVATVPYGVNSYSHEISVCSEFLNFQVLLTAPDGCVFTSNVAGDFFSDLTPPDIPIVTGVSVLDNGDAEVTWEPSLAPDTQGYIVYSCFNNIVTVLDTVYGQTNFVDILANTIAGPVSYLVAAIDTCYSGNPPSPNTSPTGDICNTSIHLTNLPYTLCADEITLHWTPYIGWPGGVDHYEVWYSTDGTSFSLLETVAGNETSYVHVGFEQGLSPTYYVVGYDVTGNYSVNSRKITVPVAYPTAPGNVYISTATVTGPHHVTVAVTMDPVVYSHYFKLERLEDGDDDWEEVNTLSAFSTAGLVYFDSLDVKPSVYSYTYRVIVSNTCDDVVDTSNVGKTILLTGVANESRQVNTMVWTNYKDWEQGVDNYNVYRRIGLNGAEELLTTLGGSSTFFEDDVSDLYDTPGEFCYRVEALENTNSWGTSSSAFSNELCLTQPPRIWIPNAFMPGGYNEVFKPVITFADLQSYQLVIYSRWGDFVFESNNVDEGWDGTLGGKRVEEGAYAYYLAIRDGRGQLYERKGTVIMLSGGN